MKAIETRYKGPTNTRGSRIIASDMDNNRVSIPYDHAMSTGIDGANRHRAAAQALADKMGWKGELIGGATKRGYVFVFTEPKQYLIKCDECKATIGYTTNLADSAAGGVCQECRT